MTVHLACADVEAVLATAPLAQSWLSETEAARAALLLTRKRQSQFLAARWQLRLLLAQAFGGLPQEWVLDAPADAPPWVRSRPELSVSISHSGNWTACAVGDAPLGLDLEAPQKRRDITGLAELCFTAAERALFAGADSESLFYELWTVKEAWLKRRGEWIAPKRLQELEARPDAQGEVRTWRGEGWRLALCAGEPRLKWWSPAPQMARAWSVADVT